MRPPVAVTYRWRGLGATRRFPDNVTHSHQVIDEYCFQVFMPHLYEPPRGVGVERLVAACGDRPRLGFNMDDDELYSFQIRIRHDASCKRREAWPKSQRNSEETPSCASARPVGMSGTFQVWLPGWQSQSPQILTHYGQNWRPEEWGAPVRRRNGDEIVLLCRETTLPATGSPTNVESPIRRSGMSLSLGYTKDIRCCKSRAIAKSTPCKHLLASRCSVESIPRLIRGQKSWGYIQQYPNKSRMPTFLSAQGNFSRSKGRTLRKVETRMARPGLSNCPSAMRNGGEVVGMASRLDCAC